MPWVIAIIVVMVTVVGVCRFFGVDISSEATVSDYARAQCYISEFPELHPMVEELLQDGKLTLWEIDTLIGERNALVRRHNEAVRESIKQNIRRKKVEGGIGG